MTRNPLPREILRQYLDTAGDGTGDKDMTGDYRLSPEEFKIVPPSGQTFIVERLHLLLRAGDQIVGSYGQLPILPNGIELLVKNGGDTVVDLTAGEPISTIEDWSVFGGQAFLLPTLTEPRDLVGWLRANSPFVSAVAGTVPGLEAKRAWGRNDDVDTATAPETVWIDGGLYPFSSLSTDVGLRISSSSAADTAAGTGARTIVIEGLATPEWVEQTEEITMNGTSTVNSAMEWRRINKVYVKNVGSGGVNAGAITVVTSLGATLVARIVAGAGESQAAVFSVGGMNYGLITSWNINRVLGSSGGTLGFALLTRTWPGGGSSDDSGWRQRSVLSLVNPGGSTTEEKFHAPILVPPYTDIDLRCLLTTTNNSAVSGAFEVMLLDKDEVDGGVSDTYMVVEIDLSQQGGIALNGTQGDYLAMRVNDDFSTISTHRAMILGRKQATRIT